MSKVDEHEPAWLSSENDEKIREEVAPLFGTGEVSLQDPVVVESRSLKDPEKPESKSSYGAVDEGDEEKMVLVETAPSKFEKRAAIDPETLKPHRPGQNPCLWIFHLLEGITVTASLCLMVSQIIPFLLVKRTDIAAKIGISSMALRLYISIFCILFVLTELGTPVPLVRNSQLLQTYASRGFMYSFLGLICVEEAYSERVKDIVAHVGDSFHVGWTEIFMEVSSWLMLTTGTVYMLLGVCCCKGLRDSMKQQELDAWKKYREDMAEWKRKFE